MSKWVRNFIWIGDVHKNDLATVGWNSICAPKQNCGLQVLELYIKNKAYVIQLV